MNPVRPLTFFKKEKQQKTIFQQIFLRVFLGAFLKIEFNKYYYYK
jgi:hypothetical protein